MVFGPVLLALVVFIIIFIFVFIRPYFIRHDTVIAYSGGLGSGKSYLSVKMALKLLDKNRRIVKWENRFIRLKNKIKKQNLPLKEKPKLYSNIPIRISKKEMSIELTADHLLLRERLAYKSIVLLDEIDAFANQFEYKHPNIIDNFNEFVRLFRHYTHNGYLVVNTQCSENMNLFIRRRLNTVFNLMRFRVWFKLFYTVRVRNINISEEIKTVEEDHAEDSYSTLFGLAFFSKKYDTHCYSVRYDSVDVKNDNLYKNDTLKKHDLLAVPKEKRERLTK